MAASPFVLGLVKCEMATEKMPSFTSGNFAEQQIDGRCTHSIRDETGFFVREFNLHAQHGLKESRSPATTARGVY